MKEKSTALWLIVFLLTVSIVKPCLACERRLGNTEQERKRFVFEKMISRISPDKELSISSIKDVTDFLGNHYSVVECCPTGYMIFCENSGVFVEYSLTSDSPYLNKDDRLFYNGPTYYYCDNAGNAELEHTLFADEHIPYGEMTRYSDACNSFLNYNLEQKNELLLDYIKKGENSSLLYDDETAPARSTLGSVYGYSFFANMTSPCGSYQLNGLHTCCGYTGLALLIAYRDTYVNDMYMADAFWFDDNELFLSNGNNSFTAYLRINHGTKDNVNAAEIKAVSESYFQGRGLNVTHTSKSWGFFNRYTIMDAIDNDNPVLLIGSFDDPQNSGTNINHAVVAYAYSHEGGIFGSTVYTVHFGIDYYSEVYVTGSIGSIYILS